MHENQIQSKKVRVGQKYFKTLETSMNINLQSIYLRRLTCVFFMTFITMIDFEHME